MAAYGYAKHPIHPSNPDSRTARQARLQDALRPPFRFEQIATRLCASRTLLQRPSVAHAIKLITLVSLLGGVALLLWGVGNVRRSVLKIVGDRLAAGLHRHSENRLAASMFGFGVTSLTQSSMATAYLVTALAGAGIVPATAATAVLLGADVGAAAAIQVISRSSEWIAPALFVAGIVAAKVSGRKMSEWVGRALFGVGLVLLSLSLIRRAFEPIAATPEMSLVVSVLSDQGGVLLLIGVVLTLAAHSSMAVILIVAAMAGDGIIPFVPAAVLAAGANIGSGLLPWLANRNKGRDTELPVLGNLIVRAIVSFAACTALWIGYGPVFEIFGSPKDDLLTFHLALNAAAAGIGLALLNPVCRLCGALLPKDDQPSDEARPRYLNETNLSNPPLALSEATRESLRMGDLVQEMLVDCMDAVKRGDRELARTLKERKFAVDQLNEEIKTHLAALLANLQGAPERKRAVEALLLATNLKHIGDVIDQDILGPEKRRRKAGAAYSDTGLEEIEAMHAAVCENLGYALSAIVSEDPEILRSVLLNHNRIRKIERRSLRAHLIRIASRHPDAVSSSTFHIDMLRSLKTINSHVMDALTPKRLKI